MHSLVISPCATTPLQQTRPQTSELACKLYSTFLTDPFPLLTVNRQTLPAQQQSFITPTTSGVSRGGG